MEIPLLRTSSLEHPVQAHLEHGPQALLEQEKTAHLEHHMYIYKYIYIYYLNIYVCGLPMAITLR